jgi:hypothetical protein
LPGRLAFAAAVEAASLRRFFYEKPFHFSLLPSKRGNHVLFDRG